MRFAEYIAWCFNDITTERIHLDVYTKLKRRDSAINMYFSTDKSPRNVVGYFALDGEIGIKSIYHISWRNAMRMYVSPETILSYV